MLSLGKNCSFLMCHICCILCNLSIKNYFDAKHDHFTSWTCHYFLSEWWTVSLESFNKHPNHLCQAWFWHEKSEMCDWKTVWKSPSNCYKNNRQMSQRNSHRLMGYKINLSYFLCVHEKKLKITFILPEFCTWKACINHIQFDITWMMNFRS